MSALAHARESRRGRVGLAPEPASGQIVLVVGFVSADGREWSAIGGGATVREAIAFARESCPAGTTWRPAGWEHVYAD
jgi:hypothetical protein